jgi:CRP-like cAMP-binding protein
VINSLAQRSLAVVDLDQEKEGLVASRSVRMAEIINACGFLSQVDPQGRARLLAMASYHQFPKGKTIFRQDDPCPGVYIVGNGRVRIYKVGPSGKEHVLHLAGPGQTFAEVAAIGGFDCPAYAEAIEPTDCVLLPSGPFKRELEEHHELCLQIIGGLTSWVRQLVGLMEDIVLRDATSRVARYLLNTLGTREASVKLPSLKKHLASHLNLTSETLSRSLRRLEEAGLIERTSDGRLRIADFDGLEDVSIGESPRI